MTRADSPAPHPTQRPPSGLTKHQHRQYPHRADAYSAPQMTGPMNEPGIPKKQPHDYDGRDASCSVRDARPQPTAHEQPERNVGGTPLRVLNGSSSASIRHKHTRSQDVTTQQHQPTDEDCGRKNAPASLQLAKESANPGISLDQSQTVDSRSGNSMGQTTKSLTGSKAPSCTPPVTQPSSKPHRLDERSMRIGRPPGYTESDATRALDGVKAHSDVWRLSSSDRNNPTATSQSNHNQNHAHNQYRAPHSQPLTGLSTHHKPFDLSMDALYFGKLIHVDSIVDQPWTDRPGIVTGTNENASRVRVFLMYSLQAAGGPLNRFAHNERRMREFVLVDNADEGHGPKTGHLGTPVVRLNGGKLTKRGWIDTSRVVELPLEHVSAQSIGGVFRDVYLPLDQMRVIKTHARVLGNNIVPSENDGKLTNYGGPWDGYREYIKS